MTDINKKLAEFGIAPVPKDMKLHVHCYFGGCPECGENDGFLNVEGTHVFVCHIHKTGWIVGVNLFSAWKEESEEIWEANIKLLKDYRQVEPLICTDYPYTTCSARLARVPSRQGKSGF